ncbi:MAG: M3 family oligoendopeptidase [Meiothermus silvanus]|nr:M3 family oligoendopeptidase [Allomeiothermus silvanus]MCL6568335.1 M3 family oligoendopeptidase [Allomeiothermus silvanus]
MRPSILKISRYTRTVEQTLDLTWDLSDLYASPTDPELIHDLEAAKAEARSFRERYAGNMATLSPTQLEAAMRSYEAILERAYKPLTFASLAFATDTQNDIIKKVQDQARQALTEVRNLLLFVEIELKAMPEEEFAKFLQAPELAGLRHWLARLRAYAPHTLSEKEERVLNLKSLTGRMAWSQFYTEYTSRFRFRVQVDGEEKELNDPQTRSLLRHPDPAVRRNAHAALYGKYAEEAPTLTYIFNTVLQDRLTDLELRSYTHPLGQTALDDELTPEEIERLLAATEAHYPLVERYHRLKARRLGFERLPSADRLAPWGQEPKVSYLEAKEMTLEALGRFSPKLRQIAQEFFDKRWIDVFPKKGKRGGAFCSGGLPSTHPYLLLNHTDDLDSAHTLAHEMGHGLHYMLMRHQRLLNFGATTPLAETASVFAEILLDDLILERLNSEEERAALLANRLEDAVNTAFRQVMYTRWELEAQQARKDGIQPAELYNQLWRQENQKLYGQSMEFTELDWVAWSGIPHFVHYRFYCYSYAYGYLLVLALYNRYREEGQAFVPKYLEILAAGESDSPQGILAKAGINPADPGFWEGSFKVIESWLSELEALA